MVTIGCYYCSSFLLSLAVTIFSLVGWLGAVGYTILLPIFGGFLSRRGTPKIDGVLLKMINDLDDFGVHLF